MGKLVVIDGLDGSGKKTQFERLMLEAKNQNISVQGLDFPDYESKSSTFVKMYLSGEFGDNPSDVNAYTASSFYAMDRVIQYMTYWNRFYNNRNTLLVANRYLSSNIIHQSSKLKSRDERFRFYNWVYDYETVKLGLPVEDITIILSLRPDISQKLLSNRYAGDDTKKDIHESNLKYLYDCYKNIEEASAYLNSIGHHWEIIDCTDYIKCDIRPKDEIFTDILKVLYKYNILERS